MRPSSRIEDREFLAPNSRNCSEIDSLYICDGFEFMSSTTNHKHADDSGVTKDFFSYPIVENTWDPSNIEIFPNPRSTAGDKSSSHHLPDLAAASDHPGSLHNCTPNPEFSDQMSKVYQHQACQSNIDGNNHYEFSASCNNNSVLQSSGFPRGHMQSNNNANNFVNPFFNNTKESSKENVVAGEISFSSLVDSAEDRSRATFPFQNLDKQNRTSDTSNMRSIIHAKSTAITAVHENIRPSTNTTNDFTPNQRNCNQQYESVVNSPINTNPVGPDAKWILNAQTNTLPNFEHHRHSSRRFSEYPSSSITLEPKRNDSYFETMDSFSPSENYNQLVREKYSAPLNLQVGTMNIVNQSNFLQTHNEFQIDRTGIIKDIHYTGRRHSIIAHSPPKNGKKICPPIYSVNDNSFRPYVHPPEKRQKEAINKVDDSIKAKAGLTFVVEDPSTFIPKDKVDDTFVQRCIHQSQLSHIANLLNYQKEVKKSGKENLEANFSSLMNLVHDQDMGTMNQINTDYHQPGDLLLGPDGTIMYPPFDNIQPFKNVNITNSNVGISICDRKLNNSSRSHSVGGDNSMIFNCPWPGCNKIFNRFYNLRSHYRIHSGEKPFLCNFCDASFARNHDLKRHEKIHLQTKSFICNMCNKMFSRNDALYRHIRLKSCVPARDINSSVSNQSENDLNPGNSLLNHHLSTPMDYMKIIASNSEEGKHVGHHGSCHPDYLPAV